MDGMYVCNAGAIAGVAAACAARELQQVIAERFLQSPARAIWRGFLFGFAARKCAIRGAGFVGGQGVAASALVIAERFLQSPAKAIWRGFLLLSLLRAQHGKTGDTRRGIRGRSRRCGFGVGRRFCAFYRAPPEQSRRTAFAMVDRIAGKPGEIAGDPVVCAARQLQPLDA